MRAIHRIVLHHSASPYGCVAVFRGWHMQERGWTDIGYHVVLLNGLVAHGTPYDARFDGAIEIGRPWTQIGAHVAGHNADSLGVCLVGTGPTFTSRQWASLIKLLDDLRTLFPGAVILGHRDLASTACPGFLVQSWLASGRVTTA
jgi:N-acetylmuramoyl-L-alanine amidase